VFVVTVDTVHMYIHRQTVELAPRNEHTQAPTIYTQSTISTHYTTMHVVMLYSLLMTWDI